MSMRAEGGRVQNSPTTPPTPLECRALSDGYRPGREISADKEKFLPFTPGTGQKYFQLSYYPERIIAEGPAMIDMLKEIILDFQEVDLPTGVPRRVDVTPVSGKATVCIGVRRSGKSTFMFQLRGPEGRSQVVKSGKRERPIPTSALDVTIFSRSVGSSATKTSPRPAAKLTAARLMLSIRPTVSPLIPISRTAK